MKPRGPEVHQRLARIHESRRRRRVEQTSWVLIVAWAWITLAVYLSK